MKEEVTREQILAAFPLLKHLAELGIVLRGQGAQRMTTRCPMQQHKKDHWCVTVWVEEGTWHCNDHQVGGSVIDWMAFERGCSPRVIYHELAEQLSSGIATKPAAKVQVREVAHYDYTDEKGTLLYQVVRMEPKNFPQRRPDGRGGWIPNLDGVTRVLYHMPEVLLSPNVIVAEGEKDVDNLRALGFCATCNSGGAGKWLSASADWLKGKTIIIIADADEKGRPHAQAVLKSVQDKALSVKLLEMPPPHKDASDFIATFSEPAKAKAALLELFDKTPHALPPLPLYTIEELGTRWREHQKAQTTRALELSRFLPSLGKHTRKLVPGEVALILAETGVGKTAFLQCLSRAAYPLPSLYFEMELPGDLIWERYMQIEKGQSAEEVCAGQQELTPPTQDHLGHLLVCEESGLTCEKIENYIRRAELKGGLPVVLVLLDYINLVGASGTRSRYEAMSYVAEQMKVIAKRTETIIWTATQVSRPEKKREQNEPTLYDGKDSGSLENSAGLVLGLWRPKHDTLKVKILKNTKGTTGQTIDCNFDGRTMRITERIETL